MNKDSYGLLHLRTINSLTAPWLFYAGFLLLLLSTVPLSPAHPAQSAVVQISRILGRTGGALLALRILFLSPRYPRYVLAIICLLVFFRFTYFLGGVRTLFYTTLAVAASRDVDMKLTMKLYLAYLVFFLLACPAAFAMGWADNVATHSGQLRGNSYGFSNPNSLAIAISAAVFLWLYLSRVRRPAVIWAVCWLSATLVFFLTLSLTQVVILLALPLISFLFRKMKIRPWLPAALPVLCLVVSVALACLYGPGLGSSTFESRFSMAAMVYGKNGLSLFGQDCGLTGWFDGSYPFDLQLDNAYLGLFLCDGLFAGLVGMAFLCHLCFLIGKKGDALLAAIACCTVVSGMMEPIPFNIRLSFLPLLYLPLVEEFSPAVNKRITAIPVALVLGSILYAFFPWHLHRTQTHPSGTIGEILPPDGFVREEYDPASFSGFIEDLPLARPGSVPADFNGTPRDSLSSLCYRIVDCPLTDRNEQCADVCMRLYAEYLYQGNNYREIRFADTRGRTLRYRFGAGRQLFRRYLKEVFLWSNTESLSRSLAPGSLKDIAPGDVFVYEKDARPGEDYGHAVMVAAVAVDTVSARRAVLLIQGSTPACDIHVVADPEAPGLSPWHLLDETGGPAPVVSAGKAVFYPDDLRHF